MRDRSWTGRLIGIAAVIIAVSAGFALGSGSRLQAASDWACASDQIGSELFVLSDAGGAPSAEAAVKQIAEVMRREEMVATDLAGALAEPSETDRYDSKSGEVFQDGAIVARFAPVELADGTWAVGRVDFCSAMTPQSKPGPTPLAGAP